MNDSDARGNTCLHLAMRRTPRFLAIILEQNPNLFALNTMKEVAYELVHTIATFELLYLQTMADKITENGLPLVSVLSRKVCAKIVLACNEHVVRPFMIPMYDAMLKHVFLPYENFNTDVMGSDFGTFFCWCEQLQLHLIDGALQHAVFIKPERIEYVLNNCRDSKQRFAIHSLFCSRLMNQNRLKILELLVTHGAQVNVVDANGKTPLVYAQEFNLHAEANYLKQVSNFNKRKLPLEEQNNPPPKRRRGAE